MSEQKQMSQGLKTALDLGPVLGFFVAYQWLKDESYVIGGTTYDGFIVVTAVFIPVILAATGLTWWLTGRLSKIQVVTALLVVFFGGLTVWLNDERFVKMKTTIVYAFFVAVLGFGLLRGRSYLQWVMGEMMPLTDAGWMTLTKRLTVFFGLLAVSNEIVWRTMSTEFWVTFETFGLPAATFAFFIAQARFFEANSPPEDEA